MLFHSFTHLRSHNALPISKNIEDILSPNSRKRRKENSAMQSSSAVVPNKYQSPVKRKRGYLLVNYIHTLTYLLTYLQLIVLTEEVASLLHHQLPGASRHLLVYLV
jgi:hypothetical protein